MEEKNSAEASELGRRLQSFRKTKRGRSIVKRQCKVCFGYFGTAELRRHLPQCRRAKKLSEGKVADKGFTPFGFLKI